MVIAIIGILAALITAAAAGALKRARQAQIKTEVDQIHTALLTYKDNNGSFPPNCQVDGTGTDSPIEESTVLSDLRRHLKQAFPRHRESDTLIAALAGLNPDGTVITSTNGQGLRGGMTAGEAIVFWLGGFSPDPQYPISGEGGPSYVLDGTVAAHKADPIESRPWVYPVEVARLRPRDGDGYFPDDSTRYIVFMDANGVERRINFWQYVPPRLTQPFVYFDTSRHVPEARFDPPVATALTQLGDSGQGLHVHAIKRRNDVISPSTLPIQFATPVTFQILQAGIDDAWGEEAFERMSAHGVQEAALDPMVLASYLLFPDGPFTGDVKDTIVNFSDATLEASQP